MRTPLLVSLLVALLCACDAKSPVEARGPSIEAAQRLLEGGQRQAALAMFSRLTGADARILESRAHVLGNDWEKARLILARAHKASPTDARLLLELGSLNLLLGRFLAAERFFDRALLFEPRRPEAYRGRARARAGRGQTEAAVRDFTTALRLAPDDVSALLGRALAHADLGNLSQALIDADLALLAAPGHAGAHWTRASIRQRMGDASGARDDSAAWRRLSSQTFP